MQKTKLTIVRKNKKFTQEYMAKAMCMDVSNYNRREKGQIKIAKTEWEKLTEILNVPMETIYENEDNMVFVFNVTENGGIFSKYAIPQYLLDTQKKYVDQLEAENQELREKLKLLQDI